MSKISVRSFRQDMAQLLLEQQESEQGIDIDRMKREFGNEINSQQCETMSASSEFFADPTLFSLLRKHKEAQMNWERRSRVREEGRADQPVSRKPQAKDVLPNRVLEEDDEKIIQDMEENDALGPDQYINPLVPKKRRYVAESKVPAILRHMGLDNPNEATQTAAGPSTPSSPLSVLTPTTDAAVQLADLQLDPSQLDDEDADSQTAAELPMIDHPDIPGTHLSRTFIDMARQLNESPLQTVKQSSVMDLLPRHRGKLNYALVNRPTFTEDTSSNERPKKNKYKGDSEEDDENEYSDDDEDDFDDTKEDTFLSDSLAGQAVLSIAIYSAKHPDQRLQEFHVLGSQPLTVLRDAISCPKDFCMNHDRKDYAQEGAVLNTPHQKLSSSYLFIEGVFYVDTRAEEAGLGEEEDLSAPIRQWVMEKGRYKQPNLATYTRRAMQDTVFEDLEIRLNQRYLLSHQDGCDHLVLIRDLWIHGQKDPQDPADYPITVYNWRYTRHKCTMCTVYPAEFITTDDILSGFSPCYFCRNCYASFHFDKDGNQVSSFSVSEYSGT